MIQLYKSTNTDYEMNGDYTLSPLSCVFECNLNDTWLLTIENPIDNSLEDFTIGAVVSAPTPYGDKQLFRIYDVTKDDNGISASAFPIFLDARNDCFLWDVRPSNVTGQTALNQMITNKKYSASSNITKTSTAYYVQKNLIEALNGDDDNAFLKRWGGEIAYNNYEIIVNDRLGSDNGLRVEFGFNLLGVNEQINNEDIVTRIIPKAYNGYILPNNETVDSPLIRNYPIVHTIVIEYQDIKLIDDAQEDDAENGITVCNTLEELYAALRTRANKEFENGIDLPQITYNVDMVDLSKTDLYKDYKNLLTVNLGDTVHVKHRKLEIETSARVISMAYDCITQKVESLVLGDYEANYFNSVSSITHSVSQVINTSNNTLMADKIAGIINLLNTSLRAQKDIAQKQDVRAILFEDLDPDSPNFGALCIGTQGLDIAKERNETNTDWLWGTAINFNSINADYIITGILTDRNGNFYLDMNTGDLRMKNGTFVGNITGGSIKIGSNFSVDSSGNLVAKNANFQGDINGSDISGGNITGVNINGAQIKLTRDRYVSLQSSDADKIRDYITGRITLTDEEKERLDINNDGTVSSSDYLIAEKILAGLINNHFIDEIFINYDKSEIVCKTRHSTETINVWGTKIKNGGIVTGKLIADKKSSDKDISIGFSDQWFLSRNCGLSVGGYNSGGLSNLKLYTGGGSYQNNSYVFNDSLGYLALGTGDSLIDNFGGRLYLEPETPGTYDMYVRPRSNGQTTLGTTRKRFYRLYCTQSVDVSSDKRLKEDFTEFDERYIKLFEKLKPTLYRLKALPKEKSKLAGFIAQEVEEAMKACGIEKREFGIYKYDEENDSYSLVYEMFIPLTFYYIQTKQKEFEKFKKDIVERISNLEVYMNANNN